VPLVAVAALVAGCTGGPPAGKSPSTQPVPPAAQRLTFEWEVAVEVPEPAREAVAAAREWAYAYYLWVTEPSVIPTYLEQHTGRDLLDAIRTASAPRTGGTFRITLVEVDVEGGAVALGYCEDDREVAILDSAGRPQAGTGGVSGERLRLVGPDAGGWTVEHKLFDQDVDPLCDRLGPDPRVGPDRG
jgi:hypothetical protein